jgi:hypothetical protein
MFHWKASRIVNHQLKILSTNEPIHAPADVSRMIDGDDGSRQQDTLTAGSRYNGPTTGGVM